MRFGQHGHRTPLLGITAQEFHQLVEQGVDDLFQSLFDGKGD